MARLSILTKDEISTLYSIPSLDDEERSFVFTLDEDDKSYLAALVDDTARKLNYILQLGYYRAVNYFFRFSFQMHPEDVQFVLDWYFPGESFPKKQISKNYHYQNRAEVMRKFAVVEADSKFEILLIKEARNLAKRHVLPRFVLQELLAFCLSKSVIRLAYTTLQDIVADALRYERNRLVNKFYTDAGKTLRSQLDSLLQIDDLFYNLTLLKKDQKNFSTKEIRNGVAKQKMLSDLYRNSLTLVPKLGISEQNIIYYAELAEYYPIYKLKQFKNKNQARLYLLCYVHRRFLRLNDHLVTSLIYKVDKYKDEGDDYQRSKVDIAEATDRELRNQATKVLAININEKIPDDQVRKWVFEIIPKPDYKQFLKDFKKPNMDRDFYRWESYGKSARSIKMNLRPLFNALTFTCAHEGMAQAVSFLRNHAEQHHSFEHYRYQDVPMNFFPKMHRKYLTCKAKDNNNRTVRKIDGDRYEFMVYMQLCKEITDGTVFVRASNSYRALEDELIDIEHWAKHKKSILAELNMPLLNTDITGLLDRLQSGIEEKYLDVNERIRSGENDSIKMKYSKKGEPVNWTLPYIPVDDGINNPFYEQLHVSGIGDIMRYVADTTGYLKSFTHFRPQYSKVTPDLEALHACIIASAIGIETKKMKEICDVKEGDLDTVAKSFLRRQTLCSASDLIINQMKTLPIFDEYNLADYGVHASVDGQKLGTRYNTIKSRHSKKYFGLMKGVVLYTLNANHLPLRLKVIGANEHESHFLLDIVESNTSDVEIASVSGDMHSVNRVNFALLHLFGYRFMPRFTQLNDKSKHNLVGFGEPKEYEQLLIKPSKQAEKALIIKEWDNVLRILASLALKKTTQSQIVRKLSFHKKNPTLKALIALDQIIMTDYILDYIDSKEVRTVVQASLCRGESYHQLSSTIAKVNNGKILSGKDEIELGVNAESIRLIATVVIFYNATLLSQLYEHYRAFDPEKAKEIARLSPVAWQHLSFIGKYEFYRRGKPIDIQEIVRFLLDNSGIDESTRSQL